ncbi:MAG: hypothetical protein KDD62_13780, partial [Bdellovibrionales bacterium]|nr:hypothetical protein [Bdellovibrionales bacterium]
PYAAPGVKVAGKVLESVQKKGVLSEGMVCSEQEIGFSENNEFPPALPANAQLGDEVADLYSLSGQPVVAEFLSST